MGVNMNSNSNKQFFEMLQTKIEKAIAENRPIDDYVKKQISILKESHDEFILSAQKQGFSMNSPQVGEIEVQQYSAMKALAQKIGLPIEEYDEHIKNVQIRVFGEENYKRFFENK